MLQGSQREASTAVKETLEALWWERAALAMYCKALSRGERVVPNKDSPACTRTSSTLSTGSDKTLFSKDRQKLQLSKINFTITSFAVRILYEIIYWNCCPVLNWRACTLRLFLCEQKKIDWWKTTEWNFRPMLPTDSLQTQNSIK